MIFRIAYEVKKAGTPWAVEGATGERHYFRQVCLEVPSETELVPGVVRFHGYLVAEGVLLIVGDTELIVRKPGLKKDKTVGTEPVRLRKEATSAVPAAWPSREAACSRHSPTARMSASPTVTDNTVTVFPTRPGRR